MCFDFNHRTSGAAPASLTARSGMSDEISLYFSREKVIFFRDESMYIFSPLSFVLLCPLFLSGTGSIVDA